MRDHLLVTFLPISSLNALELHKSTFGGDSRELVPLGRLDDIVQNQNISVVARLEHKHILIFALLVVKHLVDLQSHGLPWPHVRDLPEPTIYARETTVNRIFLMTQSQMGNHRRLKFTFDGRVNYFAHLQGVFRGVVRGCSKDERRSCSPG